MKKIDNLMFAVLFFLFFSARIAAAAYIGEAEARSIAFRHAGLSEKEVSVAAMKQYEKRGTRLYDITFSSGSVRYSYEIDAASGEIMEYERESASRAIRGSGKGSQDYIGYEKAKSIALNHSDVSEDEIRKYEAELDYNRGRAVYEIEFDLDRTEYEYEIDAATGEIVHWKSEYD
jgi:uncharacterized membrane protein YkoI